MTAVAKTTPVELIPNARLEYIKYNYVECYDEACYHVDGETVDIVVELVGQVEHLKELLARRLAV